MQYEPGPAPRHPDWLLPAVLAGVALLAVIAGSLLVIVLNRGTGSGSAAGAASTAPSLAANVMPSESGAAAESPSTGPTAVPTPSSAPVIGNTAVVEVVDGPLNVREAPGEGAVLRFALVTGSRLFIIGRPTEIGDLRWYRVGVISNGDGCWEHCNGVGYVATPIAREQWIQEVAVDCPPSPMDAKDLVSIPPLELLHCYGSNEIEVIGTVNTPCCGYVGAYRYTPAWLANPVTAVFLSPARFEFRHDPATELNVPERGDVVRVTGHFEDPAAPTCRASIDPDFGAGPIEPVEQALIVLNCRATFVWKSYELIGHEELGPCC